MSRILATLLAVLVLAGCGVGPIVKRADNLMKAGQHDAAIAKYDEAVRRTAGAPAEQSRYAAMASKARLVAAHHHLARGDNERERRHLRAAGKAFKKAASYAPTDKDVVQRQADLLKTRLRIETDIDESRKLLAQLQGNKEAAKDVSRWLGLVRMVEGLQAWQHDYPAVKDIYELVAEPAADALVASAEQLLKVEAFDQAMVRIQKAMRLRPNHKRANELHEHAMVRGNAGRLAQDGHELLGAGRLKEAIKAFEAALKADPKSVPATQGLREARRRFVEEQLAAVKRHLKARDKRAALVAARAAEAVGTDYPKVAKLLKKHVAKLSKGAAKQFYKRGRRAENKGWWGAALVNYRTAAELGGGSKDVGKRLQRAQQRVAEMRNLTLFMPAVKVPKEGFTPAGSLLAAGLQQRFQTSNLPARGVVLLIDKKQARRAAGTLTLAVQGFDIGRASRSEARRKKYLDRVEFPHNPQWDRAQSTLSATLAVLNAATDELRPVQESLNAAEAKLTKLDADLVKLKNRIRKEDALYYQNKKAPCPDGTTNCRQSYANRRWAKHLSYYRAQIAKQNGTIGSLSPRYTELRDKVHKLQEDFRKAEHAAHNTPKRLREEIWLDYNYDVTLHELKYKAQASLTWQGKAAKKRRRRRKKAAEAPLAAAAHTVDEHKVDFSTPGVVVKKQTLEPPKNNQLPDDTTLATEVSTRLLDALTTKVWPALERQGQRFVRKAENAKKPAEKLHFQILALSTGEGIDPAVRTMLMAEVLKATGYDFEKMAIDVAQLPFK